jgi:hypothetical protein
MPRIDNFLVFDECAFDVTCHFFPFHSSSGLEAPLKAEPEIQNKACSLTWMLLDKLNLKFHKNRLTECGPHWGCAQSRMIYGVVPGKSTLARRAPIAKPVSSSAL